MEIFQEEEQTTQNTSQNDKTSQLFNILIHQCKNHIGWVIIFIIIILLLKLKNTNKKNYF